MNTSTNRLILRMTRIQPNGPHSKTQTFTSHFLSRLRDQGVSSVQAWIVKLNMDLFSKDMILMPIHEDNHWSLFVLLNPAKINVNYDGDENEEQAL